nr:16S rRNA (guanine(966)-N(2))-methyltransferase RsmD [uncultured Peptostreptococcus sp.]
MRVISGSARGLKLNTPSDDKIRPTTDRVKESMFNIIQDLVYDSQVLDLFAGSGALGIEALSRGANRVVFSDKSPDSIKIVKSNIEKVKLSNKSLVLNYDFKRCLSKMGSENQKFDLVFVDPPYYKGLFEEVLATIRDNDILNKDGVVILEHDANTKIGHVDGLEVYKEKKYGITMLTFYCLEDDDE